MLRTLLHKKAMLRAATFLIVAATALVARAQQDPAFLHYWELAPMMNPAAAGRSPQLTINAAYQSHASGFEDAGGTMYAGADIAFAVGKTRHGVGVAFLNDEIGIFSNKRFSLQYAYHLRLFGGVMSVGVEADMLADEIDGSKAELAEGGDVVLTSSSVTGSKFDASAGLWYAHGPWYAALAMQHVTAPTISLGTTNEYKVEPLYNFTAGYNIRTRSPLLSIAPSLMLRYQGSEFRADITARVNYSREKKRLYGGVNYSPEHSIAGFIGGTFHGIDLSYSYEAFTGGFGLGNGQHEVTVSYRLDLHLDKRGRNLHRSVRWL